VKQFYSTGVWRGDLTRRDLGAASKRYFVPPIAVLGILAGFALLAFGQVLGSIHLLGIVPAAAYLLGVTVVAVMAAGLSLKSRLALVLALAAMHMSWGWGFLRGFVSGAAGTIDKSRVKQQKADQS
jgi:hypothetical protein